MKIIISTKFLFLSILLLFGNILYAQQRTVTGKVSDENGVSLPGVAILVKGTKIGTATDVKGAYSLNVPASATTLIFSSVGMKPTEQIIGNRSVIDVSLTSDSKNLDEVVVIGYGTAKKADVTSSISSIGEKEIKNLPVPGADQALQGKVAGVTISSNGGQPGGGISVRVRGITSVNGNEPLYVVDGVPLQSGRTSISQDQLGGQAGQNVQSPLAALNPNDIASIDILKDASAQAIYGSRAANGVVLITTKSGKVGESKISYDVYYGTQVAPRRLKLLNLSQFAGYQNSLVPEIRASGSGTLDTLGEFANPAVLGAGTNWQDEVFQTGIIKNHQLSFSGGQNKTNYYFSFNYFNQTGTVVGSAFERFAIRTNIDHQVKSWLKAGISLNASRADQRITLTDGSDAVISLSVNNSPATPVRGFDGQYTGQSNVGGSQFGNPRNPIALAMLRNVTALQTKLFGSIYADINIFKFLTLRNELNYDFNVAQNSAFQPDISNATTGQTIIGPSKLKEDRGIGLYWGLKTFLTFDKGFGKHYVNVLLGHEAVESNFDQISATRQNLTQNLQSLAAGAGLNQVGEGAKYPFALESYFARATYSYDNKYSITGSIRRDGSVSFGPGNRYGVFPAVSLGWTVSNEEFAKNIDFLSYLKIRAGAGSVGNSSTGGNNAYTTNINLVPISPFGNGAQTANVGNPLLSWESVVTQNFGIDITIFNRKVDLTVDLFNKVSTNMLLKTVLPVFGGLATNTYDPIQPPVTNGGKMTNTGIDIALTTYNIQKGDFSWKTSYVFSHYKNTLNQLSGTGSFLAGYKEYGNAIQVTQTQPGGPVGSFYGLVTDGLFRSQEELAKFGLQNSNNQLAVGPTGIWLGDIRYKDINNDGVIDSKDLTVIGNPNPDFTYGMTNTLKYKGLDFSLFITGSQGGQILNYTRRTTESLSNAYANQSVDVLNRYSEANPNGTLPRYNQWNGNNTRMSDRFVEDGSYLRIQNISLGYNLPKNIISKAKLASARLYISVQNIKTFTKYTGYDPELGAFNGSINFMNVDDGHYPNPRTFTIGGNFEF